jgi:tyrosine-protein kinase Etk/Wzc
MTEMNPNAAFEGNPVYRNDDTLEIKKIIHRFAYNWYWFVAAAVLAGGVAFAYNRYTPPVYEVQSTMLVDEGNAGSPLTALYGRSQGMFQGMNLMNDRTNIHNQMAIIGSTSTVQKTLEELDFRISYYRLGRLTEAEQYRELPFHITWDGDHPQIIETDIYLDLHAGGTISVAINAENVPVYDYREKRLIKIMPAVAINEQVRSGTRLQAEEMSFSVTLNERYNPDAGNRYKIRFHTPESLVKSYRSQLRVFLPNENSSILLLTVRGNSVRKSIDFLNKLIEVYQLGSMEKKNENANRTTQFIDSQLQNISDSLLISENRLQSFRSANQMIDFSTQSQQLLRELSELDKEMIRQENMHKYYLYLEGYIKRSQETETVVAPSAMGIDDPLLNGFIKQLNELISEKSSQTSIRQNSQHPTILQLNAQIAVVKNSLKESISNIIRQSDQELEGLDRRISSYNVQIRRLPATERNFINFERKYKIDSETYTFLLQKLAEAQIAKASSVPDSQVIEEPGLSSMVQPQKRRVYAIALMLGLIFPAAIIFLRDFFNNKIESQDEIEALTDYPVIGHTFNSNPDYRGSTLLLDKPGSRASEPYRDIRNKLNLMVKGIAKPVIAVLSSSQNEGKSYNVINIASSYAIMQKKTVILDLDLRNPAMKTAFKIPSDLGVVNYLTGNAALEDITFSTNHPLLNVIPAGPIPPNPAEVLLHPGIMAMISRLREEYDMVVIDAAPVGIVSDIFPLSDLIDASVFIVRHKFTKKQSLKDALRELGQYQMNRVAIVINCTTPQN